METSTINQLIESIGMLIIVCIAMLFYMKATKWRSAVNKEIILLKDCYFYRQVIDKYKKFLLEDGGKNYYNTFRSEVKEETGITSSESSQPNEILNRLKELRKRDKELEEFMSKIKIS